MIEKLLKYQEVDSELKSIEDELKGSEEYKKLAQASKFLKSVNDNRVMFEDRSGALASNFEEKEIQFKKLLDEKNELDAGIVENTDEKEVAYLNRRAQELQKKLANLEEEIKSLSSEITDTLNQYNTLCKKTKFAIEQGKEFKEKYDKLVAEKEGRKAQIEAELLKLEKGIPLKYMEKYKEKRKDGKFKIVCEVKDGFCTACGTELVIAEKEKLKAEGIIECTNCHKLIYSLN